VEIVIGLITGFGLFIYGFLQLEKKNLIENIPTSKIRSVAMGLAELTGKVEPKILLKSPITQTECVFYKFIIEEERRNSKGKKYWVKIKEGRSTNYFYIKDDTARILVDPISAELVLDYIYRYIDDKFSGSYKSYRYTEWYIVPNETIYIIGTVKKIRDNVEDRKSKLVEILKQLKQDKEKLKQFDVNKNGQIDIEEWDMARMKIEQELIEQELSQTVETPEDELIIAKGDIEKTFIISDHSEKQLISKYIFKGYLSIISGFSIIVISITTLLSQIGLLPKYLLVTKYFIFR
jgi:hypothetical protein